jgi:hypothetical protein
MILSLIMRHYRAESSGHADISRKNVAFAGDTQEMRASSTFQSRFLARFFAFFAAPAHTDGSQKPTGKLGQVFGCAHHTNRRTLTHEGTGTDCRKG